MIDVLFTTDEERIVKLLDEMFDQIQQNKPALRLVESLKVLPEYRLAKMISLLNPELSQTQEQSYCAVIRKGFLLKNVVLVKSFFWSEIVYFLAKFVQNLGR